MPDDVVLVERDGAVGVITLNRPEYLNAMNADVLDRMHVVAKELAEDDSVRCVVITGAGRGFSAGGDVRSMAVRAPGPAGEREDLTGRPDRLRQQEEISRLLYEMPKPTISAINGVAAGAGVSVSLAADIRIASEQARFLTAFAKVGYSGDFGGTWLLQRLVGPGRAKELYLLGDAVDAQKALALGMVTKVVPHESLMQETMAMARQLAAGPTLAFARMKDNFVFGATSTFGDALTREAENMKFTGTTADHKEAALAFLEKREPQFVGR